MPSPENLDILSIDDAIWRAYYAAIFSAAVDKAPGDLKPSDNRTRYWPCAPNTPGIPSIGQNITQEAFNSQLYSVGDNLIDYKSPVYATADESYFGFLSRYVVYVAPDGDDDENLRKKYKKTVQDIDEAQQRVNKIIPDVDHALLHYNNQHPNPLVWDNFAQDHYPAYVEAKEALNALKVAAGALLKQISGPTNLNLDKDSKKLLKASDPAEPLYSMPCAVETETHPVPESSRYKPAYKLSGNYQETVRIWMETFLNGDLTIAKPKYTYSLDISMANTPPKPGTPSGVVGGEAPFKFCKYKFDNNTETEEKELQIPDFQNSDLKVTLTFLGKPTTFNISPGDWDIPRIREAYPNLITPPAKSGLKLPSLLYDEKARVQSMIVAYGTGLEVTFSERVWNLNGFGGMTKDQIEGNAQFTFMGITAGAAGRANLKCNVLTRTLSIKPDSTGTPDLLGVIGTYIPKAPGPP